ncbi:hypothetical protein BT93_A2141 [Corymbia citriodora subsp. variegata]|nr:hypothetical protein BT93_A2141 [Corymbia citriodora subsp. variegata]
MQKVVFKLDLHNQKEKKKAMRIASGFAGVESIDVNMKDQKLTVVGTMDPVELVEKLGKLCPTEIVAVGPAKEAQKKDDGKDNAAKKDDGKKDNAAKKDDGKSKPKDPKPDTRMVYFQQGFYGPPPPPPLYYPGHLLLHHPWAPPPPPPPYYPGHYYQPPPPPPSYYYGGYVSIEEDPNGCVIC